MSGVPVAKTSKTRVVEFISTPLDEREKKFTTDEIRRFKHEAKVRAKRNLSELLWISAALDEKAIKEIFDPVMIYELLEIVSMRAGDEKVYEFLPSTGPFRGPIRGFFYRLMGEAIASGHNIRHSEYDPVKCEFISTGLDCLSYKDYDINHNPGGVHLMIEAAIEKYMRKKQKVATLDKDGKVTKVEWV